MTLRLLLAATLCVALGACGVPREESADVADPESIPFGLLDEDRQPVTGTGRGSVVVEVFLYAEGEDLLLPVARRVDGGRLADVLAELETAPTDAEAAAGLRNPLADADAVADAGVEGGVAVIDLSESFADIGGADQLIAIAQLVFTATGRPGVGQASFTLDGQPVEIPRGDGSLTSGIVTRDDYRTAAAS